MCRFLASLLVLTLVSALVAPSQAAPLPTLAEAQADFNAGQYRPCMQKVAALLSNTSQPPAARSELLKLRGECALHLNYGDIATAAFHSAAQIWKTTGPTQSYAEAEAVVILIKASPKLQYSPQSPASAPAISIVDPEKRKAAMNALVDDRIADLNPKIKTALEGKSLTPIMSLVPALRQVYLVELAATGQATRTLDVGKALGTHARDLIQPELQRIAGRIQSLDDLANEPSISGFGRNDTIGYRGLTSPERQELQDLANELVKIEQVSHSARRLAQEVGGTPQAWDAILADCGEIKQLAQATYDKRY